MWNLQIFQALVPLKEMITQVKLNLYSGITHLTQHH